MTKVVEVNVTDKVDEVDDLDKNDKLDLGLARSARCTADIDGCNKID